MPVFDNLPVAPISDKNGNITPEWRSSLQQTITQLQSFLSNDIYQLPVQPTNQSIRNNTQTNSIAGLATPASLGSVYHDTNANNPSFNLKTYTSASSEPNYSFVPATTYQNVATIDDLNAIPMEQINGKLLTVTAMPNKAYIGVNNGWQVITTADM